MKSKTIILSSPQNDHQGRGILTIYEEDDLLKCKLRLYNTPNLSRFCKLGIYHQKEVFSANLLEKGGIYTSSLVGDFDIEKDFYTAIVDTENDNNVILAGGTYAGFFYDDQSNVFSHINKENPNTNLYDYTNEDISRQEETLDSASEVASLDMSTRKKHETICHFEKEENPLNEDDDKCKTCKYKEYFYSCNQENINYSAVNDDNPASLADEQVTLDSENEITSLLSQPEQTEMTLKDVSNKEVKEQLDTQEQQKSDILTALIPQFDYVFNNYEADETLNNLIPNSKFVKINENQEQYSIGAIYEEDKMRYICYAVMKDYNVPAPQELGKHYQWLPLDKEDPLSEGYYIVFQDASDLKIVEL